MAQLHSVFTHSVLVGFHFRVGRCGGWDSFFRDGDSTDPGDGVEDNAALVVVLPVFVEMAAGESEGAATADIFRSLERPHHVLGLFVL